MKNKLSDLNDHLFSQIERLSDEDLKGDALQVEIDRAESVIKTANAIISNSRLVLDAHIASKEWMVKKLPMLPMSADNEKE